MIENKSDFEYHMNHKPDFGYVTVKIPSGQTLKVEASAMATMDTNIKMTTRIKGFSSRFLTGENIFINEFTALNTAGEIGIAPGSPGDVEHVYLDNSTIYLQNTAFLASGMNVTVESRWQGLIRGFFSGEKLFLIKCSGTGDLFFNSYGGIIEIDVRTNFLVDTGHIVAFTHGLDYNISRFGGYKSLFFSGEGLVCNFYGTGKVWIQTKKLAPFKHWIHPFRRVQS